MCNAVFFPNPLDLRVYETRELEPGVSVGAWLVQSGFDARLRTQPVVVGLNGDPLLEEDFDRLLEQGDVLTLQAQPQWETVAAVVAWIAENYLVVAAIATAAFAAYGVLTAPDTPEAIGAQSPNQNLNARGNRARLGQAIPVGYGRIRYYPDLSSAPYVEFNGRDDQVVTLIYELGQGNYTVDVAQMRFEDTLLSSFRNARWEVIAPGQTSTLFPSDVTTSTEVQEIELDTGLSLAYAANPTATTITQIGVDFVAPRGLYRQRSSGKTDHSFVEFEVQAREIDNAGAPLGPWTTLGSRINLSGTTPESIRRTYKFAVTAGRYEVRINRTSAYVPNSKHITLLNWVGLRGYHDGTSTTTTTRIAVEIRSSNEIGSRALTKFNVPATRLLPTWSTGGGWGPEVETRNPVWAYLDAVRNSTYGGNRPDAYLNLTDLEQLAADFDGEGIQCDGIFDTVMPLWDALTRICHTCFCVPLDEGGIYTMVRDVAQTVPVQMFNMRNSVRGTFSTEALGALEETHDGVLVEYFDEDQDYRAVTVLCEIPGEPSTNPKKIRLWGVVTRSQAWEVGMRLAAMNRYRRELVKFETGLEGRIPRYGELVRVSHYVLGVQGSPQISGDVVAYDGVDTLTLTENPQAPAFTTPYIVLHNTRNEPVGPYLVTVLSATQVQVQGAFDDSGLLFSGDYELPRFQMGDGQNFDELVRVLGVEPIDSERVRISGYIDQPAVYTVTNGEPVPPAQTLPDLASYLPSVTNFTAELGGNPSEPEVYLTWDGQNSDRYDVERSLDGGTTWFDMGADVFQPRTVDRPNPDGVTVIFYRVAGISIFAGPWETISIDITTGVVVGYGEPAIPNGLTVNQISDGVEITAEVPSTEGRPDVVEIWRAESPDTKFADAVKIAPNVPVVLDAIDDVWRVRTTDAAVLSGRTYSYFVVAKNTFGEASDHFPTGTNDGVPITLSGSYGFPPPGIAWGLGTGSIRLYPNQLAGGTANDGEVRVSAGFWEGGDYARETIGAEATILTPWEGPLTEMPEGKIGVIFKRATSVVGAFGAPILDDTTNLGTAAAEGFYGTLYDIADRTFQVFDNAGNLKAHTPGSDRAWAYFTKGLGTGGIENFIQVVPFTRTEAGSNLYDSAQNLLADIDVRNDQLVQAALGFANQNPSFSLPRVYGSLFGGSFKLAPSSWFCGNAISSALVPGYENIAIRDVMEIPDASVIVNSAVRVHANTSYEFVALVRAAAATIEMRLFAQEYDGDELPAGKVAIGLAGGEVGVQTRTRLVTVHVSASVGTTYQLITGVYTPSATCKWFSMSLYTNNTGKAFSDYAGFRDLATRGAQLGNPSNPVLDAAGNDLGDVDLLNDEIVVHLQTDRPVTVWSTSDGAIYEPQMPEGGTDTQDAVVRAVGNGVLSTVTWRWTAQNTASSNDDTIQSGAFSGSSTGWTAGTVSGTGTKSASVTLTHTASGQTITLTASILQLNVSAGK